MDEEFNRFHNRLRKLLNIDHDELVAAGIINPHDPHEWVAFRENPWRTFLRLDDERAAKVWAIIEGK